MMQGADELRVSPASETGRHREGAGGLDLERSSFRARMTDHLPVAVGTTLGLFFVSDGVLDGPYFKGHRVPAFLQVGLRYYAATVDPVGEPALFVSDDDGETWGVSTATTLTFPDDVDAVLGRVCQLQLDLSIPPSPGAQPVLAGVDPAALFRSSDGITFELVRGLWDLPDRAGWEPPGDRLHTVLTHADRPGRITVAIGSGGIYRSDDGGETWLAKNGGIAMHPADDWRGPRRQIYKLAMDAAEPDSLFAQTDTGTYHSENGGDSWRRVSGAGEPDGLPTDFGFAVVCHVVEPNTAYVFPLESEWYPCSPEGRPRVYRTTDSGGRWVMLGDGLSSEHAHTTVVSDAFAIGHTSPYPLVFGTRAGQLFASLDRGQSWRLVSSGLPPVLCVRVLD